MEKVSELEKLCWVTMLSTTYSEVKLCCKDSSEITVYDADIHLLYHVVCGRWHAMLWGYQSHQIDREKKKKLNWNLSLKSIFSFGSRTSLQSSYNCLSMLPFENNNTIVYKRNMWWWNPISYSFQLIFHGMDLH